MKKTVIVEFVLVNCRMGAEGWERGERGKNQGRGSCYQTGDQGGWEFATTSKKLALQISRGSSLKGFDKIAVHCVNIKYLCVV
jgi:hypothetical protein